MRNKTTLLLMMACALLLNACAYIVLPEDLDDPISAESKGWSAVATSVGKSDSGALHIELTIRNETADWSAMQAADKPARLVSGGKTTDCETVFVGTGGHRLAPNFRMRGYIAGTKAEPRTQLIYVECAGVEATSGAKLSVDYVYVMGPYNYYEKDEGQQDATLEVNLDEIATDLTYPVVEPVDGLIQMPDAPITALNDCVLTLTDVARTDTGLQFTWTNTNPGEYPTYVHVGMPPVIGSDGILYGFYQTPDIVSVPVTPAGDKAEWTTEVAAPADVKGLYIMLSVESGKQRTFLNYAIDITDK